MIKSVRMLLMLAAFGVVLSCAASGRAQMTGGYKAIPKTDAGAVAAADFAIKAQSAKTEMKFELSEIMKAERQVVAGTNYRLCMQVSADGDEAFFVQAVIYLDLKRNYKLTSWADSTCGETAAAAPVPAVIKVGGFKTARVDDADIVAAAEFAVEAQNKKDDFGRTLVEVLSAEEQLVAGMNYRLCLKSKLGGDEGEIHFVRVVVYRDLKKVYKLTKWADDETCGKNE